MKRYLVALCLILPAILVGMSGAYGTLPFGPGFQNGKLAATIMYADTAYVGGVKIGATGASGATAQDISDSLAAAGAAHDYGTHADGLKWDGGSSGLTAATGRTSLELGAMATKAGVDSGDVAAGALSPSDISNGATGFVLKTSVRTPSNWNAPLPVMPDTLQSGLDSLTVILLADIVNLKFEYAKYLHAFGNGSAAVDSVFLADIFEPRTTNPDSVYFWVKASTTNGDSASVVVVLVQVDSETDEVFNSGNVAVTAKNTWERKVFAFDYFFDDPYAIQVRFRLRMAQTVSIGPVWFK